MRRSLLLFAILLGACAGGDSDPPVLTFAEFANPPTTSEVLSDSPSTVAPLPTTTSVPVTTSTTTLIVVDAPSAVAISTESGFSLLEGRGAPRRLVEEPVAAAFDDLSGGFVFQLPGAGSDPTADQRIFWSRDSRPDAEPFLDVDEGSLLALWGTEEIDGAPHMILTITDHPDDPDQRVERLVAYGFGSGDRVLGEVGGDGSGPITVTYGGGRYLLEQQAGEQTVFQFRNDQGAVLDLSSNPQPGCAADPSCARRPALHPSGSFVAYIEGSGDLVELVVLDLDLDEEVRRILLPASLGEVTGLDYEDDTVLINRISPAGRTQALIVNVPASTVGEFGLTGHVQFLRQAPAFDGAVTILDD
jgi:hypothetical protein